MKTARMVIDHPEDMPLGPLHKALAEVARQHGLRLRFEPLQVPKGSHFVLEHNYYRVERPKGAA